MRLVFIYLFVAHTEYQTRWINDANIVWNDSNQESEHIRSLTAYRLTQYLKQHHFTSQWRKSAQSCVRRNVPSGHLMIQMKAQTNLEDDAQSGLIKN